MWLWKILLLAIFSLIFLQDYKDRTVYWFLYPLVGILVFLIQLELTPTTIALINTVSNLAFIVLMISFCYLYTLIKLKKPFLQSVLGLGDILFFMAIAFSFSIASFLVLFVFSLIFSLLMHTLLKHKQKETTVPLAGYMALFFGFIYALSFCTNVSFLYAY